MHALLQTLNILTFWLPVTARYIIRVQRKAGGAVACHCISFKINAVKTSETSVKNIFTKMLKDVGMAAVFRAPDRPLTCAAATEQFQRKSHKLSSFIMH